MRAGSALGLALLWQSVVQLGSPARPENFRFWRSVAVQAPGTGPACAPLDATVLSHTASPSHSDLRLFRRAAGEADSEVPYLLTESGPEPVADTEVPAEHTQVQGNRLSFDLPMPARPFSEVKLRLDLQNFVATARVEGWQPRGGRQNLGSVAIFDLSAQLLGRWTSLLLAESRWPWLHVELDVRTPEGAPRTELRPSMVLGAEVPPSRLRQTLYVPVTSTTDLEQRGMLTVAMLRVPAHVPVERVAFRLAPNAGNFAREVTVSARADGAPVTDTEALDAGQILNVSFPSSDPRLYPIDLHEDALDATMGATLARPAMVLVAVDNDRLPPLPIQSVTLEMRERKLCFFADRASSYVLRYGDPGLLPPIYDDTALNLPPKPLEARLGAEEINPAYRPRQDSRSFLRRHPEFFWLLVLISSSLMGGTGLHLVQHRRVTPGRGL